MSTLVECVPNFSEGRDRARVDAIVDAMKMDGVYLLDREMDADHNRCVITLVGEGEAIQEAAIRGVGKAAELIDLNQHQGAHPRMGAADVVPFIPIEGLTLEDCVTIRFRSTFTRRRRPRRNGRIWRTSAGDNLREYAKTSPLILPVSQISAILGFIGRQALRWLVRANSSSPITSFLARLR